jgi:hypothetical protein
VTKGSVTIRIDLLIIQDDKKTGIIKNEISQIMKRYNVIEYKSPKERDDEVQRLERNFNKTYDFTGKRWRMRFPV